MAVVPDFRNIDRQQRAATDRFSIKNVIGQISGQSVAPPLGSTPSITPTNTPTPTPTPTPTVTPTVPANVLRIIAGDILKTIDNIILTTIQ